MNFNVVKFVEKLRGEETQRGPVTIYVDKAVWKSFRAACKKAGLSSSKVMEGLMKEFIEGVIHFGKD